MELAADIEAFLADEPTTALPENRVERTLRFMRRELAVVIVSIVTLVLLTIVFAISAVSQQPMRVEVAAEARQRLRLAANLASRVVGTESDCRWRILALAAADTDYTGHVATLNDELYADRATTLAELAQKPVR